MRAPLFTVAVLLASFAGAIAACTTTTTTTEEIPADGGAAKGDGSSTSTGDAAAKPDTGSQTPDVDGDEACAAEATQEACGECCIANHQEGAKVIQDAVLACACDPRPDAGTACQTECADTACKNPPAAPQAGDACTTCLQGSIAQGGACLGPAGAACQKNADCMAEQQCIAKCASK